MKVSLNWLRKYVTIDLPADELIKGLVRIGFDLESVENQADKLNNFVIGKVLEKKKHPNADKLTVCKVDIGTEILNIVCGAPNVDAGQIVCVAKVGAVIPNGDFEIKKSKIRGEFSEGMICSEKEMNLGDDKAGIMVLEDRIPIGKAFSEYLGQDDVIIDIGITPNRGDLLSHIGVAREVGFIENNKVKIPELNLKEADVSINDYINVEILNPEGCHRYCGRFVKNVKVKESPSWLKKHIIAAGLRPINNIVDVTNFVMLECGQPLHAFDYNLVEGKKIIVKNSGNLKHYTTLDGKERTLREDVLLICDAVKPVGIAGIMGGENSEIREDTKNVFIESAYFDPVGIRKSSKFLGLQTDSSYRFERGVDMDMVEWACNRAASLISELSDGEVVNGLIDNYPKKLEKNKIALRMEYLDKIVGIKFEPDKVIKLLEQIDIKFVGKKDDKLTFEIPFFRYDDLKREIDLIEEIARLNGYENIPDADYDRISYITEELSESSFRFVNELRTYFVGRGFKEIITNPLVNEKYADCFGEKYIKLLNPSNVEMNVYRANLYIGALDIVRYNFNFKISSLKLFETGDIAYYGGSKDTYVPGIEEKKCILLTLAGEYDLVEINRKPREYDLFDLKGELQGLLGKLHIDYYKLNCYNYNDIFEQKIDYVVGNDTVACIFKYSDACLRFFEIEKPVYGCEIFPDALLKISNKPRIYKELSKYPPVLRDLSIVVDKKTKASEIEQEIISGSDKLLKSIRLYDLYKFEGKESDKLSYTFTLEFSSNEKTLTDEEINKVQEKIIKNLKHKLNAELRN